MLIEFSVANFRSFRELQLFSLVKAKGGEHGDTNSFTPKAPGTMPMLRAAAIYGPTAGGKSNFLEALQTMRGMVLGSATQTRRGDPLPAEPFLLDAQCGDAPSEFEVSFIAKGVRYQYGLAATTKRITAEWLYAYPNGRAQKWFTREYDDAVDGGTLWETGSYLTGEKQLWIKSTRDNALFLSTAVQLNSEQLQPVYDWFRDVLHFASIGGWTNEFTARMCEQDAVDKERVLAFLRAADLDIDDIRASSKPFDRETLPDALPEAIKDQLEEGFKDHQFYDVQLLHTRSDGKSVAFDIEEESEGTRRLFAFAGPWLDALANGYVLMIDELNNSLHPALVQFLVKLFHSDRTNPNNAQLVFTTHETSILNQDVFRRDQIWFCSKNREQVTELVPLTDYKPRKGRDNLESAYLTGRYGAVPFVQELQAAL